AVLNLVVNARDAMPRGGRLTISTAIGTAEDLPPARRIAPGLVSIVICVADTGEGMDEQTLERLFEPFFTTKEPTQGTGLGLAMVYSFVQMAGGHIQVHSKPGAGSSFCLGFPRAPTAELSNDKAATGPPPRSRSDQIILVVEDDDDVRQHSVETLRDLGYRVLEAHDGQAALSLLAKHKGHIGLMFCDIGLPNGENGRDLASQARLAQPSLRVLYTSGSAEGGANGGDQDVEAVIPKPFTTANLAVRIREMLDWSPVALEPSPAEG
ncbi:MAG TPA: ATP-binding protein, partial [Sphingomicrobium sp.]|nr:ATP-binding protein [Sphingomicrobium sp.]